MKHLPTRSLRMLAGAALLLAAAGAARADAFAQSILVIDNFRLLHSNGTPFSASDFSLLTGTNDASAGVELNGVFAGSSQEASLYTGTMPPSFAYAGQRIGGSIITTSLGAHYAQFQTRADAALAANGSAAGTSKLGAANAFSFSLGMGEAMTIAFSALPTTRASADGGANAYANARLSWSISLLDATTGAIVFDFAPEQLNTMADVAGADGAFTYSPGWLTFSASAGLLAPGDLYQVTIAQSSYAGVLQAQSIPEPGTLAVFGLGLLAMAALLPRRQCRRRSVVLTFR